MNQMDGGDSGPGEITIDPCAVPASPSLTNITGGGLHMLSDPNDSRNPPDWESKHAVRVRYMLWHGSAECGDPGTAIPGDINNDCYVNLDDVKDMAAAWITTYQLDDFAVIASEWLNCTNPLDGECVYPYVP